jgi:hypothetical protein
MWQDEIDDPEYQDDWKDTNPVEPIEYQELYYQPITCLRKNILNAITGYKYPYLIGSKDEQRFYIIMTSDPVEAKEACRLFFSSPEEYENFSGNKVSDKSKRRFRDNQLKFR